MYAINIDENNRILRTTFAEYAKSDSIIVDTLPTGETVKEQDVTNWLYVNGEYVYSPKPEPEKPGPTEYVSYDEMAAAIKEGVNSYNG